MIVGSILLAFGIEAGWQARGDRNDERAYLEGLLKDVRYDRTENRLVSSVLTSALAESEALINIVESGTYRSIESERLIPLFMRASDRLRPDYSRATYEELVNSGRIGLIRSSAVRTALAGYDRNIANVAGAWEAAPERDSPLYQFRIRTIPAAVERDWLVACREAPDATCPIEFDDSIGATLRVRLDHAEMVGDIRESMSTQSRILLVVQEITGPAAAEPEAALLAALDRQS